MQWVFPIPFGFPEKLRAVTSVYLAKSTVLLGNYSTAGFYGKSGLRLIIRSRGLILLLTSNKGSLLSICQLLFCELKRKRNSHYGYIYVLRPTCFAMSCCGLYFHKLFNSSLMVRTEKTYKKVHVHTLIDFCRGLILPRTIEDRLWLSQLFIKNR